jgi:hypothetical protein
MNDQAGGKKRLVDSYDRLSIWMKVFTGAVAVGLVMEYFPDVVRAAQTNTFPEPLVGALLITVGVAGELVILIWSSRYETKLREFNDSIIAETGERAAKAEKDAAEANLARVRVEEKFKRRKLNTDAVKVMTDELQPYKGIRIDVFVFDHHIPEVVMLADSLNGALKIAGCDCRMWMMGAGVRMLGQSLSMVCARDAAPHEEKIFPFLTAIIGTALLKSDIRNSFGYGGFAKTDPRLPYGMAGYTAWDLASVAPFRIQIVERSFTDDPF